MRDILRMSEPTVNCQPLPCPVVLWCEVTQRAYTPRCIRRVGRSRWAACACCDALNRTPDDPAFDPDGAPQWHPITLDDTTLDAGACPEGTRAKEHTPR